MTTTNDWPKLGRQQWTATIWRVFPGDRAPGEIQTAHRGDRASIVRWVRTNLPIWANYRVFAEIRTGSWVDNTFDDPTFGHVQDAVFEDADLPRAECHLVDGGVEFEWEETA